jgi:multidrug resistance efflux pump
MSAGRSFRGLVMPFIAVVMLVCAFGYAILSQQATPIKPPPVTPPTSPFGDVVAGSGFVEPATEASTQATISVGANLSAVVVNVAVHVDHEVQQGDLLFQLDKRALTAELKVREAAVVAAEAQLSKLEKEPRPEELPAMEATIRANTATLTTAIDVRDRIRKLREKNAETDEDLVAAEQTVNNAQAELDLAQANLALKKAGAWEPDKVIARAAVEQARAQLQQTQTSLDLLDVRAPVSGTILQVNVRPGEFVSASATQSLIVMGNLHPYHVRVSIDEEDIPRLKLNAPAVAMLRGDTQKRSIPMMFVRIEPAVIPKTSLTGANSDRVDTRVMQIIYSIDSENPLVKERKVLVGQLLDVFIDVK